MKKVLLLMVMPLLMVLFLVSCSSPLKNGLYAKISTTKGDIIVQLYPKQAPLTVMSFVGLAEGKLKTFPPTTGKMDSQSATTKGKATKNKDTSTPAKSTTAPAKPKPFYNGLTFHRVLKDLLVQTGDPNGNGTGGPGYQTPDEISSAFDYKTPGIVAMAKTERGHTNGSQFFITLKAFPLMKGHYTVLGKVVQGLDVVKKISEGKNGQDKIKTVTIFAKGPEYKNYSVNQKTFDALNIQKTKLMRIKIAKHNRMMIKRAAADKKMILSMKPHKFIAEFPNGMGKMTKGIFYYVDTKKGSKTAPVVKAHSGVKVVLSLYDTQGKVEAPQTTAQVIPDVSKSFMAPFITKAFFGMKEGSTRVVYWPPALIKLMLGEYKYLKFNVHMLNVYAPGKAPKTKTMALPSSTKKASSAAHVSK